MVIADLRCAMLTHTPDEVDCEAPDTQQYQWLDNQTQENDVEDEECGNLHSEAQHSFTFKIGTLAMAVAAGNAWVHKRACPVDNRGESRRKLPALPAPSAP